MRSRAARTAALLAAGWYLCGCGHTAIVGSDRSVGLGLSEYRLTPQSIRARSGVLTIVVHNYGRLTHNLVVSSNGQIIDSTAPIAPGASVELSLDLAPGSYLMASTLLSDQALGEYGTLTVSS